MLLFSGAHGDAMGVYALHGKAFEIDRFVKVNSESTYDPVSTYFLYRAGAGGRWIIVRGEAGVNEQQ